MCKPPGTRSRARRTASWTATQETSGHAAVVGATRCSTRKAAASSRAVTGSPSSAGPPCEAPATASPAAQAARTSSELRRPLRAARRENQRGRGGEQDEQDPDGDAAVGRRDGGARADQQHRTDAEQHLRAAVRGRAAEAAARQRPTRP